MFCPSCGAENLAGIPRCEKCGALFPSPPDTPGDGKGPQVKSAPLAGGRIVARLGDRLIAVILDGVMGAIFFAVIGMYAAVRFGGVTDSGFSLEGKPALIAMGSALVVGFLYYWLLEGVFGATVGKAIVGLRVRDKSGDPCTLKASVIRNLLRIIDALGVYFVGFLVAVLSKLRQRVGDHLAGTVVVEDPASRLVRALVIALWLVIAAGGSWLAYTIHEEAGPSTTALPGKTAIGKVPPPPGEGSPGKETEKPSPGQVAGDLTVGDFAFLEKKEGPVRPKARYGPGEKVYTRFAVTGFTADAKGQVHLLFDVVPLDPGGSPLYESWRGEFHQVWEDPKEPVPTTFNFDLPVYAPAGTYKLQIKVHDAVKKKESVLSPSFAVEGPGVKPASQLEIRDFQFSRSEGGPAEPKPVLQGSGTVHMAFKVAGVQFRDDRPDVNVAMRVLGPGDEVLLERGDLVQIRDPLVYHPPTFFKEITSWVTIPSGVPKGTYTASFVVTDGIAHKTVSHEAKFEVR